MCTILYVLIASMIVIMIGMIIRLLFMGLSTNTSYKIAKKEQCPRCKNYSLWSCVDGADNPISHCPVCDYREQRITKGQFYNY